MDVYIVPTLHPREGGGVLRIPSKGMIELGQQSKPKKIPRTFNNTHKIPWTKINPQQEPMGHGGGGGGGQGLLTPKHPMQNFRALKLIKH